MGLMFTVMTVGGLCGATIAGQVLDRINCRTYLALVLLFFGALVIILPWAHNATTLMCIASVLGLFEGALDCGESLSLLQAKKFLLSLVIFRHI